MLGYAGLNRSLSESPEVATDVFSGVVSDVVCVSCMASFGCTWVYLWYKMSVTSCGINCNRLVFLL